MKIKKSTKFRQPIYQVIESQFEGYWITGKNFICHQDANNQQEIMVLNEKNDYNTIIQSNHSTIWAGTTSDGIIQIKIDPQTLKVKQIKKITISKMDY